MQTKKIANTDNDCSFTYVLLSPHLPSGEEASTETSQKTLRSKLPFMMNTKLMQK